jgi:ferrous iron transport protein B
MRAKTANFPAPPSSIAARRLPIGEVETTLVDLPGLYSLNPTTPDERVACDALEGLLPGTPEPDLVLLVVRFDQPRAQSVPR